MGQREIARNDTSGRTISKMKLYCSRIYDTLLKRGGFMNGWTYLSIRIKSEKFVSALKDSKIWVRISSDSDVEVSNDTFTYYNDENATPFCEAPDSIEQIGDSLFHFFAERYDDFDSAKKTCKDKALMKTIEEVEWEYSGADDEEGDETTFSWTRPA